MTTLELHTYCNGVIPQWSLRRTRRPDNTELVELPPGAVVDLDRDGVELDDKFYCAGKVYILAMCSLRGFRIGLRLAEAGHPCG